MASISKKPDVEIHQSLEVYNDPQNATVDIVAVPGLGANAIKSWEWNKPSSNFNWITDQKTADGKTTGLARDCPTARVLLFNYASAYQGSYKIEQYMSNIVTTFLDQLKAKREELLRRPLVLIGHSMGGLVIAKSLVLAETKNHEYPGMYEAISGCMFFGTPFDGAPVADIAKEWATINEKLGKAYDSTLIDLLLPGNEALKELKDEFIGSVNKLGQKVQVHCIWEQKETHWEQLVAKLAGQEFPASSLGKLELKEYRQFVSRKSATLSGMKHTGIARTHRDLVRFESDKDKEYQLVKDSLRNMVNDAVRTARARFNDTRRFTDHKAYREILEALDGASPRTKLKALQDTSRSESWIVRDKEPNYVDWLDKTDRCNDYLWIHGPEGKGKSTAAAAIIGEIGARIRKAEEHSDQSPDLLAYFFCEPTSDYCTAQDVVKCLMRQLCQQQEILASYAVQFSDRKERRKASLSIENLWQSLEDMFSESSVGTIYLVINNLHELELSPSTLKLFSFMRESINCTAVSTGGQAKKVRTKWLITSRDYQNMQNTLDSTAVRKIDLKASEYGKQQQQTLQKYAWIMAEDLRKKKGYTMATKYLAGSIIGQRANNTKWIDVAVVQLAALPADASEIRVQSMLEQVPQDFKPLLDAAWRSVLRRDDEDIGIITEFLRALVLTYEDPRKEELAVLAGFPPDSEEGNCGLQKLLDKCKPLVASRPSDDNGSDLIGFVNADIKNHLLDHAKKLLLVGKEWIKWQHGKMSLRCLSHIMNPFGKVAPRDLEESGEDGGKDSSSNASELQSRSEIFAAEVVSLSRRERIGDDDNVDHEPDTPTDTDTCGPDMALDYAIRYWLRHASHATIDIAEIISQERLFWEPDSAQRKRWIQKYEDLTDAFSGFETASWKALHLAAAVGFPRLVAALLKEGYHEEINNYDSQHRQPVHLAAFYGNIQILEELFAANSNVDGRGPTGKKSTPLAMAAYNGQTDAMAKLIVDWHADINAIDDDAGPVLNAAIVSGNTDAINLLLQHGVRVNYGEEDSEKIIPPLALSAYHSDMKIFSTILEKTEDELRPEEFDKAMIEASAAGNLDVLKRLFSFEHTHEAFQNSLDVATEEISWEACLLILGHPPAQGLNCESLFTRAATGNETLTEVLQACWGNNEGGISQGVLDQCLYEATDKEKESTLELLLKLGADPNARGDDYGNALTASANDGTESILSKLLNAGADVNSPHGYALQQASLLGHSNVVQMLLSWKADVNHYSIHHEDRTALQAACNSGHVEITKLLLDRGANPNIGGGLYAYPIIGATCYGREILEVLLQEARGLNLDVVGGPYNGTPLATAAYTQPASQLDLLIKRGATVDYVDGDGDTALKVAAEIGDKDCLKLLLDSGADFLKISKRNKTALQYAMESGSMECVSLLLSRTDFILRQLQIAAKRGDQQALDIISIEKENRKDAMAKDSGEPRTGDTGPDECSSDEHELNTDENTVDEDVTEQMPNLATGDPVTKLQSEDQPGDKLGQEGIDNPSPQSVKGNSDSEESMRTENVPGESEKEDEGQEAGNDQHHDGEGSDREDSRTEG